MCLTGAAGIRPKQSGTQKLRVKAYKAAKWALKAAGQEEALKKLQDRSGSQDYRNAHGVMRETFVKVVNDDVSPLLSKISCPVLLVWGSNDTAVPLWMGQQMEAMIPDCGLVVFEGASHFAYLEQLPRFRAILRSFL